MKTIQLTNGGETVVDDWWYLDLLSLGPWRRHVKGYVEMVGSPERYGHVFLHRIVLEMAGHDLTSLVVDHRDGDKLNNTLANLRPATNRQNGMNRTRARTRSGFYGVTWFDKGGEWRGKWRARIQRHGRTIHVGVFDTAEEAARARDHAILAGPDAEFATLNFPELRSG